MVSIFGLGLNDFNFDDFDLDGNRIINLANPVNDTDAANKQYVDQQISGGGANSVSKTGDTMTGNLLVNFTTADSIRTLGCNNITPGKLFKFLLGDLSNRIEYNFTQPIGIYSASGMNLYKSNTKLVGIGDGVSNETSFYTGILMNAKKISDLANPTVNSDAATKLYVDNRALLPTTKYTFPSATNNSGGYSWTDFIVINPGITESEFNSLPSGLYACFTSYIPPTRIGILPFNVKGYLTCYSYQNGGGGVFNKRYTWCSVTNNSSEIFVASITENVWNSWVIQTPVLTSGVNSMAANLNMFGNKIIDLNEPTDAADAATKNYVDDRAYLFVDRFPPVDMTSLIDPSPFVVTTDDNTASGWLAFAHLDSQDWLCSSPNGAWVQITADFRFVLKRIVIRGSFSGRTGTIATWELYGSNDGGANFVTLATQSSPGSGILTLATIRTILIPNNTLAFRSYRFRCINGTGSVGINYIGLFNGINNFDIYGENIMRGNINMNGRKVINLITPDSSTDAANKGYVDGVLKKNLVGYIPILDTNISRTGFFATANNSINGYAPFGAFNCLNGDGFNGSWITNVLPCWLQIQCPEPVLIWRIALKARFISGRNMTAWNVQGSNNGTTFTTLLTSTTALLGSASVPSFFDISTTIAYQYYRVNITNVVSNPDWGLQLMQIFVYSQ